MSVGHAARNLLSMVLLEPVWPARGPESERDRGRRRTEFGALVRGALTPVA